MDKNKVTKLLRLRKFKLEEEQMKLAILEKKKQDLLQQILLLDEQVAKERSIGSKIHNVGDALANYIRRIELEKEEIYKEIESLENDISAARELVNKAFVDKKSIEKIIEKIEEKEKIIQNRQEQKKLDELVGNEFFK